VTGLNDINDIPSGWRELLAGVQSVCPSAVIAGGALRDRDNGRAVKDLDVFIRVGNFNDVAQAISRLADAGFEVSYDETSTDAAYPEDQNLEVVQIADLHTRLVNIPVQLIFTTWPTEGIVDRFDYGICRLSFDGEKIVRPPEYDEDREKRVFRLRRDRPTPAAMRGSILRYARLTRDKYEGWDWAPHEEACPEFFI
jgi:hypothetical protein